jgi:hypothetical protein
MRVLIVIVMTAAIMAATTGGARAESDVEKGDRSAVIATDATALGMIGLGVGIQANVYGAKFVSLPLIIGGVAVYFAGAPTVHALRHHGRAAGLSVGLRVGLPLVVGALGFYVGSKADCSGPGDDGLCREIVDIFGGLLGAAVGITGAVAYDWAVLSRPPRHHVQPLVSNPGHRGLVVGVSGSW